MSSTSAVITQISDLPAVSSGVTPAGSSQLGKDAFIKLLTAQMRNQDPTNTMDSKEMVSQLAQFSSLEQLQALGTKLDTLTVAQASTNQISTASLVGKDVTYKASALNLTQGASAGFQVQLDGATDDAVAVITDPSGKVVRTLHLGAKPAGTASATWDGRDEDGNALPSGSYVLTVTGVNKDGTTVDAAARVHGTITGVRFEDGTPILRVGGRDVKMSDVIEIDAATTGA